jgi:excinuclease UvrABC ATPase subunit
MSRPSSSQPPADSHDRIRVRGARVNNLKDVSVEIPKRRLTVFTGKPHVGPSNAFSFNVPSVRAVGEITIQKGAGKTEKRVFSVRGGMCPRCEGMGSVTDIDLSHLFDDRKSLNEGAITVPGYTADGWYVRLFMASGLDPDKPIRKYTKRERHAFLYQEPTKVKVAGVNLTHEGLVPRIQKSFLSKDKDALQPHIRAFVERAVTFTACPECRVASGSGSSSRRTWVKMAASTCSTSRPAGCTWPTSSSCSGCWTGWSTPASRSS